MGCASGKQITNDDINEISQYINQKNIEKAGMVLVKLGEVYNDYNRDGKLRIDSLINAYLELEKKE